MRLGRYEYFNESENSDKFWQIKKLSNGMYLAEWGRNGKPPQASKEYSEGEVLKKINEKISKGYQFAFESGFAFKSGSGEIFKVRKSPTKKPAKKIQVISPEKFDFWAEIEKSSKKRSTR